MKEKKLGSILYQHQLLKQYIHHVKPTIAIKNLDRNSMSSAKIDTPQSLKNRTTMFNKSESMQQSIYVHIKNPRGIYASLPHFTLNGEHFRKQPSLPNTTSQLHMPTNNNIQQRQRHT